MKLEKLSKLKPVFEFKKFDYGSSIFIFILQVLKIIRIIRGYISDYQKFLCYSSLAF